MHGFKVCQAIFGLILTSALGLGGPSAARAAGPSLEPPAFELARSVHSMLKCSDCHDDRSDVGIPFKRPVPVDCRSCHDDAGSKHPFHPRLALSPAPAGPDTSCVGCHGTHDIGAAKPAGGPLAQAEACGACHRDARDHFTASAHGRALAAGNKDAPNCLDCHSQPVVGPRGGPRTTALKLAQVKLCESCHVAKASVADATSLLGTHFVASFDKSVHGKALLDGNSNAPSCVDCHKAHEMDRADHASARVSRLRLAGTCAPCHAKEAHDYGGSVHAAALRQGNLDSPSCTDCHGEHDIRAHTDPTSPVNSRNVAEEVCASCHASLRLTQKYGLASDVFQTFSDSYHGLAVRGGAVVVVNCASCHSVHAIKSHLDPTSTVYKGNLVQTCGQCHPGANTRFAVGDVHVSPTQPKGTDGNSPALYWIASIYVILITVVIGAMSLHNALDFIKKIRRKLDIQKGVIEEEHVAHRLYLRMTVNERLQHAALVLSFLLLVLTGFMLRYPEAWWVQGIRDLSRKAFEWRGIVHRCAGVALIAAGVWHACYLAFTANGRALFRDLLPRLRDFTDPWRVLKYNLGLAREKPAFGRFSYIEKVEYWALIWGSLLMGATGAVLWFDNTSMRILTKLGFDISRTIHFYEAVLATLAILVWHFYFVIFNPDVYPVNLSWLTGRMSEREMLEEHPAELARIKAAKPPEAGPEPRN